MHLEGLLETSASSCCQGTLDLLILRTLRPGPAHGHAIAKDIERSSADVLQVEQGSLYPAPHRSGPAEDGSPRVRRRPRWGGDQEASWGDYFNGTKEQNPWAVHAPLERPLAGSVTTRDGRRHAGRLVYDFDESETTETFDAPFEGVDYTIPFGLIASIVPGSGERGGSARARLILHDGEELQLDRAGDFGERNAGLLIFIAGREGAEYVPWTDVEQVDLDRPPSNR